MFEMHGDVCATGQWHRQSHSGANAASNHSHPALFVVDLLLNYAQDFVVNWIVRR